jgi:hypothetical protein
LSFRWMMHETGKLPSTDTARATISFILPSFSVLLIVNIFKMKEGGKVVPVLKQRATRTFEARTYNSTLFYPQYQMKGMACVTARPLWTRRKWLRSVQMRPETGLNMKPVWTGLRRIPRLLPVNVSLSSSPGSVILQTELFCFLKMNKVWLRTWVHLLPWNW